MNVLDLFSGIGGFSLGLERAGMQTIAFCEIDKYCQRVLKKHWPDVPVFGDVRELTAETLVNAKIEIDVICGGFPCQDISVAGKGAGIDGSRSGLWSEYARIIGEVRPRYVIVENVAALLGRGINRVLGDLAALGYDAEWHCIPAAAVGAPHRRDRVWIVAHPTGTQLLRTRTGNAGKGRTTERFNGSSEDMAYADQPRLEGRLRASLQECANQRIAWEGGSSVSNTDSEQAGWPAKSWDQCSQWQFEPEFCGMADGISPRLDGDINGRDGMGATGSSVDPSENELRAVWLNLTVRVASQGPQSDEQLARQLADALPGLSHALALGRGQETLAAASRFLHRLRQACETLGAVRDASQSTAEAWKSLFHEEAERAFLAACGRTDWRSGEWLGVDRVAKAAPSRVDRLKSLGNAIVPQIAEIIGRAILARESNQ